ncbi:ImmA/IrrE family metallo-endopeptidase [Ferruginivarius sediminum]|uniref:ImmA/IrrE family metallo-endopeptidase n=2 Tax=Ferruginivarius sediminum TaxID=2661937 RepID=A0A369TCX3_9PROT|nr:ImmA/IrrE family metallo-endopeptidase [Ferruginivarius sediminum]
MAHELGHFLYHAHLISDGVDDNRAYRSAPEGRFYNRSIGKAEETEANRFAAGLLMPRDLVLAEWEKTGSLSEVAKRFQVSKQAMRIRLEGLLGVEFGEEGPVASDTPWPSIP